MCVVLAETDTDYQSGKQQLNQHTNKVQVILYLKFRSYVQCLGVLTPTTKKKVL